ncbi:hypothetical protein [Pendulispora albinea]|uniref:Uncharacterized protein n=1 Tax=Pendulispora albinea TaxID=2741071 RepID=A0ABZ2M5E4_9BACT
MQALASDAEAAWAAALTYGDLPRDIRETWLDALDADVPTLGVPPVAIYAPLLGVEGDEELRLRIVRAMGPLEGDCPWRAWLGETSAAAPDDRSACTIVLVRSLYLHFVELLICRVGSGDELHSVTHEPLSDGRSFTDGAEIDGAPYGGGTLRHVPLDDAVEVLAHAIVAHRRQGHPVPDVMTKFVDLFTFRG